MAKYFHGYLVPDQDCQREVAALGCDPHATQTWGWGKGKMSFGGLHISVFWSTMRCSKADMVDALKTTAEKLQRSGWSPMDDARMNRTKPQLEIQSSAELKDAGGSVRKPVGFDSTKDFHLYFYPKKNLQKSKVEERLRKAKWGFILSASADRKHYQFDWTTWQPIGSVKRPRILGPRGGGHGHGDWAVEKGRNCYDGHGGNNEDLKRDNKYPQIMSVAEAQRKCEEGNLVGFTYQPAKRRAWFLSKIYDQETFEGMVRDGAYEVHYL